MLGHVCHENVMTWNVFHSTGPLCSTHNMEIRCFCWCKPEQSVKHIVELPVISDHMTPSRRNHYFGRLLRRTEWPTSSWWLYMSRGQIGTMPSATITTTQHCPQIITVAHQSQKYRVTVLKQKFLERGGKVGNPFVSLLLTGLFSHDDNAIWL